MTDGAGFIKPIRVLIVDDEPLARMRLEDLLAREVGVELVGTVGDGDAAVEAIQRLRPDLVFLDVQMPGRTGLGVIRAVGSEEMPATIFVTAFDQYALQAFDVAAIDYLVKPFDDERFEQAFKRARHLLSLEGLGHLREQMLHLLGGEVRPAELTREAVAPASSPPAAPAYLERIAVESRGKVRVVPVGEIDYITSSGPYAELHVAGRVMLIREAMQTLEERLDPSQFIRIHRSAIVRVALMDTLHKAAGGDYELQLKSGVRLRVSRSRREALERWLGIDA